MDYRTNTYVEENPASRRTPPSNTIRELDHRTTDGLSVTLFWNAETNLVFLSVVDERQGARTEFEIPPAQALEAFHHPYAFSGPGPGYGLLAA